MHSASAEAQAQLETLTRLSIDDLIDAFGFGNIRRGRALLERLYHVPAHRFARQVIHYDTIVGAHGLQAGHSWLLEQFAGGVEIDGLDEIPRDGPLLVVSNHPGMADGSALIACIPRPDLRLISANNSFIRSLPHTSRYLFFLPDETAGRLGLIRKVARHLHHGGALLIFPGGEIEPDPAIMPGAVEALAQWSTSMDLLARLVPNLTIVPAVVSGVFSPRALYCPVVRIRRGERAQRRLAALLQLMVPAFQHTTVRLQFGHPIRAVPGASHVVTGSVRQMIECVLSDKC